MHTDRMKKFVYTLAAICMAVSCDLTTIPEDSVVPDSYFKNIVSHEQWLNNCYPLLPEYTIYEMEGDDVVDNQQGAFFGRTMLPSNVSWSWGMLRHINYYLEHADLCEDKEAVNYYKSLAYFWRAYFYFNMVRQWGDIMWYDRVIGSTDTDLLYKPRDSREFVMNKIIEDLDNAAKGLAGTQKNALSTNITEWAALALKTRACLFEGTFRKYHDLKGWEHFLQEADAASSKIMNEGGFSLYKEGATPYRDMFFMTTFPANECILARAYSSALSMNHTLDRDIPAAKTGFTRRFINHYLLKNGNRITSVSGYETLGFKESFANRDPRMAQTIWGPEGRDMMGNEGEDAFNLRSATGYLPLKLMRDIGRTTPMNINAVVFRYSEILLANAEARAELGILSQNDVEKTIGLIRSRVGMPTMNLAQANANPDALLASYYPNVKAKNPTNAGAILEIRRERTVELVMEGHRQWDIIRWCEGQAIDNQKNPFYGVFFPGPGEYDLSGDGVADVELYKDTPSGNAPFQFKLDEDLYLGGVKDYPDGGYVIALAGQKLVFDEKRDYLWPIPANQRKLSRGTLTQNPGWDEFDKD